MIDIRRRWEAVFGYLEEEAARSKQSSVVPAGLAKAYAQLDGSTGLVATDKDMAGQATGSRNRTCGGKPSSSSKREARYPSAGDSDQCEGCSAASEGDYRSNGQG